MKKGYTLICIILLTALLTACGSNNEKEQNNSEVKTVTLKRVQEDSYTEIVYTAKNELDIKQTIKNVTAYKNLEISSKKEAKELLEEDIDQFQNENGLKHDYKFNDDALIEELTIDYEKADIKNINNLIDPIFEDEFKKENSLKKSNDELEAEGFKVIK